MNIFNKQNNKTPTISFACNIPGVPKSMPIIPYKNYKHDWKTRAAKDIPKAACPTKRISNISRCPGISNIHNHGWVLRSWQDITIETTDAESNYTWATPDDQMSLNGEHSVGEHPPEAYHKYRNNWPLGTLNTIIKINTGWKAIIPKGYMLLQMGVPFEDQNIFTPVEAIYKDTEGPASLNIPMYWNRLESKILLKAGAPLAYFMLIPNQVYNHTIVPYSKVSHLVEVAKRLKFSRYSIDYGAIRRFWSKEPYN